jgi:hypothetical protein
LSLLPLLVVVVAGRCCFDRRCLDIILVIVVFCEIGRVIGRLILWILVRDGIGVTVVQNSVSTRLVDRDKVRARADTHTDRQTHTHTHTLSLSLSLSLTHTHTVKTTDTCIRIWNPLSGKRILTVRLFPT